MKCMERLCGIFEIKFSQYIAVCKKYSTKHVYHIYIHNAGKTKHYLMYLYINTLHFFIKPVATEKMHNSES